MTAYGMLGSLSLNEQESYGTTFTGSLAVMPMISEAIDHTIEQLPETNIRQRFGEPPYHTGRHGIAGNVTFEPLPLPLGFVLRAVFGRVLTTSASDPDLSFTHEFISANSDFDDKSALPPHTVVINRDVGSGAAYEGVNFDGISFNLVEGALLSATANLIGSGVFSQVAEPAEVNPLGVPWTWDVVSASLGGEVIEDIRNLTIEVANNLEAVHTLQMSKSAQCIKRTDYVIVTGNGTLLLTSSVHSRIMDDFTAQTEQALVVTLTGITSPSVLTFDIPLARLEEFTPRITGNERLEVDFSFRGIYSTDSSYPIAVTLTNTQEGYPTPLA